MAEGKMYEIIKIPVCAVTMRVFRLSYVLTGFTFKKLAVYFINFIITNLDKLLDCNKYDVVLSCQNYF